MSACTLQFWDRVPPYAAFAAARFAGMEVKLDAQTQGSKDSKSVLILPSGDELHGDVGILRYIVRANPTIAYLYGTDAFAAHQVDGWLDTAATTITNGPGLGSVCAALDDYMALRTYMVGDTLTLADLHVWGRLGSALQFGKLRKANVWAHLERWYDFVSAAPELAEARAALDWKALKAPAAAPKPGPAGAAVAGGGKSSQGSFDIHLPGAEQGKVVTRFPPEPSGYLHIGHAKAALMNQYFRDAYDGTLILRFDDTNPSKEKDEFVENILIDIKTLGLKYDRLTHSSDYFPQLLDLGTRLIKAGFMYADDTPMEEMRAQRREGTPSVHRDRDSAWSLEMWQEMQAGSEKGLEVCMRFKINMSDGNKAMRDPVAYRCNLTPHWRTGTLHKVYPTYDCACPFIDAIEGVTHALRTSEYKDREAQYYWVLAAQQKVWEGLPSPHLWDFARLNFVHTVLSKRKLLWFVDTGRVEGWTDPRFPTVQGIVRRGLLLAALKEYILSQGASKNVTLQEWDKLWSINKRMIDPVAPRHTGIVQQGKVAVTLSNGPAEVEVDAQPRHKKNPACGMKATSRSSTLWIEQVDAQLVQEGEEVTLMDWGNCFFRRISKDAEGQVTGIEGELHLEGDFKKTKTKLTWLADIPDVVPLTLVDFGYLIKKKKIEEEDVWEDIVNEDTRTETAAVGDANMRVLQHGDVIQLERKGYFKVDKPYLKAGQPMVLLNIPDGRAKAVGSGRK